MSYKYISPTTQGYIKIKMSKKDHKKIFGNYDIASRYEYYENKISFMYQEYTKWWLKLIDVLFYPIWVILHGIADIPQINKDICDLILEKRRGHFYDEYRYKDILSKKNIQYEDHFKEESK